MGHSNRYNHLTDRDIEVSKILVEFIDVASKGLTKPYDHTSFIDKMNRAGASKMIIDSCCPPSADVHDSKDFKPYIMSAVDELFLILDLKKKERIYE